MAFTTSIIYTPANEQDREKFIQHLEKVGMGLGQPYIDALDTVFVTYPNIARGTFCTGSECSFDEIDRKGCIECGSNLYLACALSALRDDSDKHQWFYTTRGKWILSKHHKKRVNSKYSGVWRQVHFKATAEELIEHFKTE